MQGARKLGDFVDKFVSFENELPSFKHFLTTVLIYPLEPQQRHKVSPKLKYRTNYKKYLRLITISLLREKSKNTLLCGIPEKKKAVIYNKRCQHLLKSSFFSMNELYSYNWSRVFHLIGSMRLSELIINWKGFVNKDSSGASDSYIQVFGDGLTYSQKPIERDNEYIQKFDLLNKGQKNPWYWNYKLIKSKSGDELMKDIFNDFNTRAKRFRRVRKVLDIIVKNDVKLRYDSLYQKMLLQSKVLDIDNISSNASSLEEVIKFIFVILGKLFTLETWGGDVNKKVLRGKIIEYLKLEPRSKYHIHDLCKGLQLSGYKWFGKDIISSKQDFEMRSKMMKQYILWIFESLIKKILKEFWYVTESFDGKIMYFPRYIWCKISTLWLERYAQTHFIQTTLTGKELYNYGKLKLIPKRATFRLVCVPSKREIQYEGHKIGDAILKKQEIEFNVFRANELRPVRLILLKKFNERSKKEVCYRTTATSNQQIAERILSFRTELLNKYDDTIPKLYMIKFDMKDCYDRIDQKQLFSKVIDLFKNDPYGTKYYYRTYMKLDSQLRIKQVKYAVDTNFANFDLISSTCNRTASPGMLVDKGKTIYLTRGTILHQCIQQIFGAKAIVQDPVTHKMRYYRRKRGVFQGFSLSSIFCDIIYSALVAENFRFLWDSKSPFLLTRLVDDFLFISPDKELYDKVFKIISGDSLTKYGAYVNHAKTTLVNDETTDETLQFVGLDIEIATLKFKKDYSNLAASGAIITSSFRTFQALLKYLKSSYSMRLHRYILIKANELFESVKLNVNNLLEYILDVFKKAYRRVVKSDEFRNELFIEFLKSLFADTLTKFVKHNSHEYADELVESMRYCLVYCLKNEPEFRAVVNWLYAWETSTV